MPKVICKLPNASDEINGVKFKPHPDGEGVVSEDITQEQADHFAGIPGYELVGAKKAAPTQTDAEKAAAEAETQRLADAELEALSERAKELGVKVKANWKADRLKAEIEQAEKAATDAGEQK